MCIRLTAHYWRLRIALVLVLMYATHAGAENDIPKLFTFTFENDAFVGEDNGYTNGMGITFGKGPFKEFSNDTLPNWLHWLTKNLYVSTMANKQHGVAYMYFQRMQTPADLETEELIIDDVPYVGLLALQTTMYAWDDRVTDQFSLYLGAVGPITFAEETQTFVHGLTGAAEPKGWNNQIGNELVFKVEGQRVWNLYRSDSKRLQFDLLGLWGAGIGNLESATKGGFAIRWGTNLQSSFPTFSLQADRQVNTLSSSDGNDFYVFLGGRVGVVFNDILVNGNTFKDSHSVPMEHFQDQVSAGAVGSLGRISVVFQISSISSSTKIIDRREEFGALSITYGF